VSSYLCLDRDSTIDDVADFVVEYINSDILGLIAIQHLIIADQSRHGVLDFSCMKLAELHSQAVDYPKCGIPVLISEVPHFLFPAKPDWKAGETGDANTGDYYESRRAVGYLYRAITLPDIPDLTTASKHNEAFSMEDPITTILKAKVAPYIADLAVYPQMSKLFESYVYELQRVCTLHAIDDNVPLSELEVVVGTILAKCPQHRRRKDLAARMHLHTDQLVSGVEAELLMADPASPRQSLSRAWQAWQYATELGDAFGARSFGLIALDGIFKALGKVEAQTQPLADLLSPAFLAGLAHADAD